MWQPIIPAFIQKILGILIGLIGFAIFALGFYDSKQIVGVYIALPDLMFGIIVIYIYTYLMPLARVRNGHLQLLFLFRWHTVENYELYKIGINRIILRFPEKFFLWRTLFLPLLNSNDETVLIFLRSREAERTGIKKSHAEQQMIPGYFDIAIRFLSITLYAAAFYYIIVSEKHDAHIILPLALIILISFLYFGKTALAKVQDGNLYLKRLIIWVKAYPVYLVGIRAGYIKISCPKNKVFKTLYIPINCKRDIRIYEYLKGNREQSIEEAKLGV